MHAHPSSPQFHCPAPADRRAIAAVVLTIAATLAACTSNVPLTPEPLPQRRATPAVVVPQSQLPQQQQQQQQVPQPPPPLFPAIFIRPAPGPTMARFDGVKNKGLDIEGNAGEPILAAADGRVVYVGGQLRGYGNMVIVKHDDVFLTAYAHTQTIFVKENDTVQKGQKIAEMGQSDTDRVKLHFEVRKNGTAVDPEPYLNGQLR
ncbi:MAG: murein hydrolase activator EnvC family protein [Janthinobacterium lividum]